MGSMDKPVDKAPASRSVDLVIRFTASIPDLVVTVASPSTVSTLSVKRLIRSHLSDNVSASRLRLISAGKVLADTKAVSQSISIPPPPPRTTTGHGSGDIKGKGKAPLRASPPPQPNARVYINCSVGDALSPTELADEAIAAEQADEVLNASNETTSTKRNAEEDDQIEKKTTRPAPRGFDRLLNSGFNPDEVATLRTQFMAIQAHTHTPDTMPTGDDLRALEDRWLDGDAGGAAAGGATGDGDGGFGAEDGGLEDMLWGNLMGFFWPIAAVCWLMREEGVWSRRRQIAVLSGMLVNITFGFLRLTN
ncbi:putative DSC E3 ubiquitin ligase complex subunit 3 [Elsinoe australis]|uniref:Putative DSC E3 ubiquitin ligase complex subunit 3 n=1 Tax=Elsinoe australis TaxID=40998 RepID=A0A4U7BA23_9PEZI|nr:putative DSC E3 ubiquitin ligase complex subunit 3 [Elsinoe australis]